jgi:hypothetical protein
VLPDGAGVERLREPQGPPERLAAVSELEAGRVGVQVGTSPRQPSPPVDGEYAANRYDP